MTQLKIEGTSRTFEEKVADLNPERRAVYEELVEALSAKANSRLSKKYINFNQGRDAVARITIIGQAVRVHFNLDPADVADKYAKFPLKDLSDRTSYKKVPYMLRMTSDLALKRALNIIADL